MNLDHQHAFHLELKLEALPLWQGVQSNPGILHTLPFYLGWNRQGFLAQTTPSEVQQKVVAAYHDDTYRFITPPPGSSRWANQLGDSKIRFLKKQIPSLSGKRVLEIGAGSLYVAHSLMAEFDIASYHVVDPAIQERSNHPQLQVTRAYFDPSWFTGQPFDYIISFSVLEHHPDPVSFLKGITRLLENTSGQAILTFPDSEHLLLQGDWNVLIHEHLNYFTQASAMRVLNACGLEVQHAETANDLFSVCVKAAIPTTILNAEMDEVLPKACMAFYETLHHKQSVVWEHLNRREKVAFHGACNGLNNFLCLSGLSADPRITVFDGDEQKAGYYLATCAQPIRHSSDSSYRDYDHVFVAASSFYEDIRRFLVQQHGLRPEQISLLT